MKKLLGLVIGLALLSCEKPEIPRPKPAAGSANIVTFSMGSDYGNQLFFNLKEQTVVKSVNRETWDLGFESGENGFRVILNSGRMMGAYLTPLHDLSFVSMPTAEWTYDRPSGNIDSTAIGDWRGKDAVYVINLGTSVTGVQMGRMKFKILSVDADKFEIEYAALTETTSRHATIQKNSLGTFTYFSFSGGQTVAVEPAKENWDICFRTYTHIYPDGMPYLLAGALTNNYKTFAVKCSKPFAAINYTDYLAANFTPAVDIIGFDWKTYDFDLSVYTVDNTKCFIVKTSEDRVFKIHFLDYYDSSGAKGAPTMELQELIP